MTFYIIRPFQQCINGYDIIEIERGVLTGKSRNFVLKMKKKLPNHLHFDRETCSVYD